MSMQDQMFVDSHSPIDFDVERDDRWQLPEPRKWEPKRISFFARIKGWIVRMLA